VTAKELWARSRLTAYYWKPAQFAKMPELAGGLLFAFSALLCRGIAAQNLVTLAALPGKQPVSVGQPVFLCEFSECSKILPDPWLSFCKKGQSSIPPLLRFLSSRKCQARYAHFIRRRSDLSLGVVQTLIQHFLFYFE
jgi:hypothetical protein